MSAQRWVIVGVCLAGFAQSHVHRVGVAPLIPTFVEEFGITNAAAGAIMTAYFWTYAAAQLPVGVLSDRFGARRVMLVSMCVLTVAIGAFSLAGGYAQSLLARCLVGLGASAVWLPGLRLINEWFPPEERGRATGIFSMGGGIGGTTALLTVPLLADRFGWRAGYALLLFPTMITLLLILLLVRPGPLAKGAPSGDMGSHGAARTPSQGALFARVFASRAIWPLSLSVLFSYGGYFSLITWLPTFLVREGLTRSSAGFVTGIVTAATIVSWPLAGYVSDRLSRRKAVYLGAQALAVPVCLGFAFAVPGSGLAGAVLAAGLIGLAMGGMITPFVMVSELFPADLVGTASGIVNTCCFVGVLFMPVVLGSILDATQGFASAFLACAGVQLAGLLAALPIREGRRAPRPVVVRPG